MKIVVRTYSFDTNKTDERTAWEAFKAAREASGVREFATYGDDMRTAAVRDYNNALKKISGQPVDLDTAHIFEDQLNTAAIPGVSDSGQRVFDWKRNIRPNADIMEGHWIEQTDELREIRRNTYACGYCGKQEPAAKGYAFCPHCIDSEYLKAEDLRLTRMRPVCEETPRNKRAPLTAAESAHLLPLYRDAQIHGSTSRGKPRIAKARADIAKEFDATTRHAVEKRDAATWILENVPGLYGNWIFYTHTGRHAFGWRSKLSAPVVSELLDKISEFPFAYDILCEDGRTLSGG